MLTRVRKKNGISQRGPRPKKVQTFVVHNFNPEINGDDTRSQK